jgi:hypothetical protein
MVHKACLDVGAETVCCNLYCNLLVSAAVHGFEQFLLIFIWSLGKVLPNNNLIKRREK